MAATTTTGLSIPASAPVVTTARARSHRRRISPRAGRAIETLAHAIEYLTDEFVHQGFSFSARNEQLEAVQILMALNRQELLVWSASLRCWPARAREPLAGFTDAALPDIAQNNFFNRICGANQIDRTASGNRRVQTPHACFR